jgi:hypothetical protein
VSGCVRLCPAVCWCLCPMRAYTLRCLIGELKSWPPLEMPRAVPLKVQR